MQQVDSVRRLKELTGLETVSLMHAAAAAATEDAALAIVSFWKKRNGNSTSNIYNLGGPRADQLQPEWARNTHVLHGQDMYYAFNSMAWFPQTRLGAHKLTGWPCWTRRIGTTRYLNAVAIELDFHSGQAPREEEMLALFNTRREQVGLSSPNILQLSGRGLWTFWLLQDEDGSPGVRAWPLQLEHWRNLQIALARSFPGLADQGITDPARLTRVPGSINSKSGTVVRSFLLHLERYTITELSSVVKIESRIAARIELTGQAKSPRHQAAGRARVAYLLEGLNQILQYSWCGHVPLGHRRDFLWAYARVLRMNRYSTAAILEALNTVGAAAVPPVPQPDIKRIIVSACKGIDWRCAFSYKGLIAKFGITPEQRKFITAWVRPQVDRDARRAELSRKRLAKQAELDCNVASLRHAGLTAIEIATQLECSRRTVASCLTRLHMIRGSVATDRVPPHVQSTYVLEGSKAKRPTTPATENFAQIGTPRQERRRRSLVDLDLVEAPVREAMKKLQAHGISVGRGTLWRDQQYLRAEKDRTSASRRTLPGYPHQPIQNHRGVQHAQAHSGSATHTVSRIEQKRDQLFKGAVRQSPHSAALLAGASTRTRSHA